MAKKTTSKKPAKANASAPAAPALGVFIVFHIGSTNLPIKTRVDDIEAGKKMLDKVHKSLVDEKPFYDKERGLLFKSYEIIGAYLVAEQVA